MTGLFRREAFEHRERDWLGSIQLIRPVSLAVLTVLVLLVTGSVVAYLFWGQYTHRAKVTGFLGLDQGVIRLLTPQAATVVESHVAEGRAVRRGDILFVLAVGQATLSGDTQAAVQRSIAARGTSLASAARQRSLLERSQLAAIERQHVEMQRELGTVQAEVELQTQRLALAREAQSQYEGLRNENFVSSAQVRAKAEEVLNVRAQLQSLDRQRASRMREIAALQAQRRELPLLAQSAQGAIDRDLAALAQQTAENEARQHIVVLAPRDGVVTGVIAEPGQAVTPSIALASLLPAGAKLQAELFAPSSAIGFVRAHQTVQLRYQAFPYQKFGHQSGEIVQVSRSPLQASELVGLPLPASLTAAGEPLYRITVALDRQSVAAYGQAQALAPGMQLEGDVMLDRRRLVEWLFEPVLGAVGRV